MDVIDFELRRYENMRNELDIRKNPNSETQNSKEKLNNSSDDFLDIMNEEKPKEVIFLRERGIILNEETFAKREYLNGIEYCDL